MTQISPGLSSASHYQSIFDRALEYYERKTGKVLTSIPLFRKFEACSSPGDVITLLRGQFSGLDRSQSISNSGKLTNWLNPTVNAVNAFSGTIGGSVSLAFPPAGVIFTGIGVLLSAATAVHGRRDKLISILERIENVFTRLENYVELPQTTGMTDAIAKVLAEVLCILAVATKEMKENRAKTFMKKLIGRSDIEDALQRLETVTVEEMRMANTEVLKEVHDVKSTMNAFGDKLQDVKERIEEIGHKDIERAERPVTNTTPRISPENTHVEDESMKVGGPIKDINIGKFSKWLCPPDPSVNFNFARDTRHKGTAEWFIESSTFRNWKESGSVLWINGKPGCGKSVLTSAIIQDIKRISSAGSAHMAYFFFDFKDIGKQGVRGFLSSVLVQLCGQSISFWKILHELYSKHENGSNQSGDSALKQCLEKMLKASRKVPIYIIIDALDESPDTSGLQSSREKILTLVQELVGFNLPNLHLCITSRPEVDIRDILEPLTSVSCSISLHDEDGQRKDIANYISSVVYSDKKINRWREKDKELVTETLLNRADGMFRWVSCQFEALRRCLAPSVRQVLTELPVTLDETYERILQEIPKVNRVHTHRLLQCLAVAVRPLRVQELAEVLAIDFGVAEGMPMLDEDMRWQDQEQAVMTACSSLIDVVDFRNSRIVQFSHCTVKKFLTSDRLAASMVDPLCDYHILLEPAHITMAKACVGVLLCLERPVNNQTMKKFPLADYAAKHFGDHAEFGNVISHITGAIDDLLDADKPHFAVWMSYISSSWWAEKDSGAAKGSPLYHVADLGFHSLVQHLVITRPQDVFARGGAHGTPVHAALHRRHAHLCQLLLPYCIGQDVRDGSGQTPLHVAASNALLEVTRMAIELGADVNARDDNGWTPLHQAIDTSQLLESRKMEIVHLLLDHGADVAARNNDHVTVLHLAAKNGDLAATRLLLDHGASIDARDERSHTPLHSASLGGNSKVVRLLLDCGADLEAQNDERSTALHLAVERGKLAAARLLLDHGASIHARCKNLWTPLHSASWAGNSDAMRLLLEYGADLEAQSDFHSTPLHVAAKDGNIAATQLLLDYAANIHARRKDSSTPLHSAVWSGDPDIVRLLLERGADIEARDNDDDTALHMAAMKEDVDVARALLDYGASIHERNKNFWTPLHSAAAWTCNSEFVQLLLKFGADLEANSDIAHYTPLHLAAEHGNLDVARLLVDHGANIHARREDLCTPLHSASWAGNPDVVRLLLERGADLEARSNVQDTALHLAAEQGKIAVAQVLLEHGSIVHVRSNIGRTPLHYASSNQYTDIIELLLENRADMDVQDNQHKTPLHLAVEQGKMEAAQLLLKHGANVHARDSSRQTPLQLAEAIGNQKIIQLLFKHMPRE